MNIEFYNSKVAVIVPNGDKNKLIPDSIDLYVDSLTTSVNSIKKYELDNDTFYSSILILKKESDLNNLIFRDYNFKELVEIEDEKKLAYFTKVHHTGVDSECYVDDNIVVCSSWVLPFYGYHSRTTNTLYGNLFRHRILMEGLERFKQLNKYTVII